MPVSRDDLIIGSLAAQDGYRGEYPDWPDMFLGDPVTEAGYRPPPLSPDAYTTGPAPATAPTARITVTPPRKIDLPPDAVGEQQGPEAPPGTLAPLPRNEPARAIGEWFFPNLSKPETYAPLRPPTMEATPEGKVPTSDPRVMGGLADLGSAAYNAMPFGGPAGAGAATAAGIGKAVFMAAIPRTAIEHAALARAGKLAAAGAHPNQIWRMGGVYENPAKQWMTEVPDIGSAMRRGSAKDYSIGPLSEHFSHPELYARAPWTANIPTQRMPPEMRNDPRFADLAGAYREATPTQSPLLIYRPEGMMSEGQYLTPRRIILHETGHAIAQRHGLPSGAVAQGRITANSPAQKFYDEFIVQSEDAIKMGLMDPMPPAQLLQRAREYALWKAYYNSAGEAASRAMETRMDWPVEQAARISPKVTIEKDVPYSEQIVNYSKFRPAGMQVGPRMGDIADLSNWQTMSGKPSPLPTITQSAVNIGGKTYVGPWHVAAYERAAHAMGVPVESLIDRHAPLAEGFLTSTGKFVSREKAMKIAQRAGQVGSMEGVPWPMNKQLTSEHLAMFGLAGPSAMSMGALAAQNRYH